MKDSLVKLSEMIANHNDRKRMELLKNPIVLENVYREGSYGHFLNADGLHKFSMTHFSSYENYLIAPLSKIEINNEERALIVEGKEYVEPFRDAEFYYVHGEKYYRHEMDDSEKNLIWRKIVEYILEK